MKGHSLKGAMPMRKLNVFHSAVAVCAALGLSAFTGVQAAVPAFVDIVTTQDQTSLQGLMTDIAGFAFLIFLTILAFNWVRRWLRKT